MSKPVQLEAKNESDQTVSFPKASAGQNIWTQSHSKAFAGTSAHLVDRCAARLAAQAVSVTPALALNVQPARLTTGLP